MKEQYGKFQKLIQRIRDISERLGKMIAEEIPESLPAIESPEGHDPSFNHHHTDFPGIFEFPSLIPDSIAPMQLIEEIEEYIMTAQMLIEDLYPRRMSAGETVVDVKSDFRSIQQKLAQFNTDLQKIRQVLTQMQSSKLNLIIDMKALRELRSRLVRIGFEYVHNNFTLPPEFHSEEQIVYDKVALQKIDQSLPPQIEQFKNSEIGSTNLRNFSQSSSNLLNRFRW